MTKVVINKFYSGNYVYINNLMDPRGTFIHLHFFLKFKKNKHFVNNFLKKERKKDPALYKVIS